MSDWIARNRKFIVAVASAIAVIGAEIPADAPSWLTGTFAALGALAVWWVKNQPPYDAPPAVVHTEEAGYPRTVEEQAEQLQKYPRLDKRKRDRDPDTGYRS